jgi:CelD/BcsL family acetyltransferase involved in cellulose biosynthesis
VTLEPEVIELLEQQPENKSRIITNGADVTTIAVVHDVEELSSLHDEWDDLVARSTATVFQTHEWLSRWWKYFGHAQKCTLHILLFRHEETLVGIAPFFIETQSLLGIGVFKRLRLMGCGVVKHPFMANDAEGGPSDYLDIITEKGYEQVVGTSMSNYLATHARIVQSIELENIREEGTLYRYGIPSLEKAGFSVKSRKADVCPFLPVPRSIDEYGQSLTPEVRRRWRRARKDFDGTRIRSVRESDSPEVLHAAFKDLVFLHQLRWNRLGYLGLFADARYEAFQDDVAEAFWHRGWLWFKSAHAGGICIASQMVFVFNKRVYGYLSGFDDRSPWAKSRPGLALYAAIIDDAIQSKFDVVDFLRGAEQYKFDLTSSVTYNWNATASKTSGFNRIVLLASVVNARFSHLLRKGIKELLIMHVFAREHGVLTFIQQYSKFVIRRLSPASKGRSSHRPAAKNPEIQ